MIGNALLAIAIPTYNRCEVLQENLRSMLPELLEHRIIVYISDDSSNEQTRTMIDALRAYYPLFVYRKNEPRLGHDANFFATLAMPDTDYVWYMGDSQYFNPGSLGEVLTTLSHKRPNFCFVNANVPDKGTYVIEGEAVQPFLVDRTWYLTRTGATIYDRASRALRIEETRRNSWTNFPQLGLILESCALEPQRLLWIGESTLRFNHKKKSSYWAGSAFEVFVKDWSALIRSFPVLFDKTEQDFIIRSHGVNTGLFGLASLVFLRSIGALNRESLNQHKQDFQIASPILPIWARLLTRLPQRVISIVWQLARAFSYMIRRGRI